MNNNISIIQQKDCFGCNACLNICPTGAIEMKENNEGFKVPFVNKEKCTNCGLCLKACQIDKDFNKNDFKQQYYIGYIKDISTRYNSSSGGVYSLFANWFLENDGYISGAVFDNKAQLKHILTNNKDDLKALRGSKYLQSDIGYTYKEIKEKLIEGKKVLFCGTPCQVSGLLYFLQKPYENLLTIDIVCHGVPSQKTFNEYLEEKFGKGQEYSSINFRDKRNGYSKATFTIKDKDENLILNNDFKDLFLLGFSNSLYLKQACETCKYSTKKRVADVTLADYWMVRYNHPEVKYENGISSFSVNSNKGLAIFEKLKESFDYLKNVDYEKIKQPHLETSFKAHKNRALYFTLENMPFSQKINTCLNDKSVGIINFTDDNENYGALFVGYSMKKAIEKLGYKAHNINYIRNPKDAINPNFQDFRDKYLNLTKPCYNLEDLSNIQDNFAHLVSGGDQVFNGFSPFYTFTYAKNKINMFSYAASLGPHNLSYFLQNKREIQEALSRFDNIAVRENSAIEILSEIGISSESYIDSVLLLNKEDYEEIIANDKNIKTPEKKYIACAIWNFDEIKTLPFYDELKKEYEFINILEQNGKKPSFGQFLNLIKNADYVIANSFHGIVFSILFEKQFIATRLNDMRDDRIITLFTKLGIKLNRLFHNLSEANMRTYAEKINYKKVNEMLEKERELGFNYLKRALNTKPKMKFPIEKHNENTNTKVKLTKNITVLKIKKKTNKTKVYLFGFIPLIKLKRRKIYLFHFIPILKY